MTIREGLLTRGRELDWSELWPDVTAMRLKLLGAISSVTETQAVWKPAPDAWSIDETIRHLLPSSRGVITIVVALCSGRDPGEDTPYDSPGDVTAHEVAPGFEGSFASLRDELRQNSIALAALPRGLSADPDLDRTFPHMYFGPLPARSWFAFQRVHDRAHLQQLEGVIGAAGYPAGEPLESGRPAN